VVLVRREFLLLDCSERHSCLRGFVPFLLSRELIDR
jgi:hypothetical protein